MNYSRTILLPPPPPPPPPSFQREGLHRQSAMAAGGFLLSAAVFLSLALSALSQSFIKIPPEGRQLRVSVNRHRRRRHDGGGGLFCDSWKYSVESNNAGFWKTVPERCVAYVQDYMTGDRYLSDSASAAADSLKFAKAVNVSSDGKDAWVFDIDETLLSNLPYYETHGFGSEAFDESSFDGWVDLANAPALPKSLQLYNKLKHMDFTIFLLTGRSEHQRNVTEKNLLRAGYSNWEQLFLRGPSDQGTLATVYKSEKRKEIKNKGYRIRGNSGDQWSDLVGYSVAERSFKLPNPMYYIA